MGIDLFTLVAEIFNFLLLVFLLHRFLFRPILRVMDERETATVIRLREAEERYEEVQQEKRAHQEKVHAFEQRREQMMEDARQESKKQRQLLIEEARADVATMRRNWAQAVDHERESFLQDLRAQMGTEIVKTARLVLRDMADHDLEERVIEVFVDRLHALNEDDKQKLKAAASDNEQPLRIRSAFELTGQAHLQLEEALRPYLHDRSPRYEVDESLLCGVRVFSPDFEVAWNFEYYIDALQQRFQQFLEESLHEVNHERGKEHAEKHLEKHSDGAGHNT